MRFSYIVYEYITPSSVSASVCVYFLWNTEQQTGGATSFVTTGAHWNPTQGLNNSFWDS